MLAVFMPALPGAFAQSGETDVGEMSVSGGFLTGAGTQGSLTGGSGIALSRYGMLLFDTTFLPLGHNSIQFWPAPSTVKTSYAFDFAMDVHVRIPVKEHWEPYAILGTGLIWNVVHQQAVDPRGIAVTSRWDQFNGAFHTGGGLRYFLGSNWGVRPEVKVIISKQTYTCVSFGIFYQVPPGWP